MLIVTLERARACRVGSWTKGDEPGMIMAEHLPKVRELSGPPANMVMLRTVGALLRAEYRDLLDEPLTEQLSMLVRQLPATE